MIVQLSDDHRMIQATVREFAARELLPIAADAFPVMPGFNRAQLDGAKWVPLGVQVLGRNLTIVDRTNTGAGVETPSLYSRSIEAGLLGATGGLRLTIVGDMLKNTSGTLTLRLKLGATAPLVATIAVASNTNRRQWFWQTLIMNSSATAQKWATELHAIVDSNAWAVQESEVAGSFHTVGGSGTSAEDTTVAKTLDVTAEWSLASTNLSFRKRMALLEVLPAAS